MCDPNRLFIAVGELFVGRLLHFVLLLFQSTTQSTTREALYVFQRLWQSPQVCKSLKNKVISLWHGRGRRFDPGQVHQFPSLPSLGSRAPDSRLISIGVPTGTAF